MNMMCMNFGKQPFSKMKKWIWSGCCIHKWVCLNVQSTTCAEYENTNNQFSEIIFTYTKSRTKKSNGISKKNETVVKLVYIKSCFSGLNRIQVILKTVLEQKFLFDFVAFTLEDAKKFSIADKSVDEEIYEYVYTQSNSNSVVEGTNHKRALLKSKSRSIAIHKQGKSDTANINKIKNSNSVLLNKHNLLPSKEKQSHCRSRSGGITEEVKYSHESKIDKEFEKMAMLKLSIKPPTPPKKNMNNVRSIKDTHPSIKEKYINNIKETASPDRKKNSVKGMNDIHHSVKANNKKKSETSEVHNKECERTIIEKATPEENTNKEKNGKHFNQCQLKQRSSSVKLRTAEKVQDKSIVDMESNIVNYDSKRRNLKYKVEKKSASEDEVRKSLLTLICQSKKNKIADLGAIDANENYNQTNGKQTSSKETMKLFDSLKNMMFTSKSKKKNEKRINNANKNLENDMNFHDNAVELKNRTQPKRGSKKKQDTNLTPKDWTNEKMIKEAIKSVESENRIQLKKQDAKLAYRSKSMLLKSTTDEHDSKYQVEMKNKKYKNAKNESRRTTHQKISVTKNKISKIRSEGDIEHISSSRLISDAKYSLIKLIKPKEASDPKKKATSNSEVMEKKRQLVDEMYAKHMNYLRRKKDETSNRSINHTMSKLKYQTKESNYENVDLQRKTHNKLAQTCKVEKRMENKVISTLSTCAPKSEITLNLTLGIDAANFHLDRNVSYADLYETKIKRLLRVCDLLCQESDIDDLMTTFDQLMGYRNHLLTTNISSANISSKVVRDWVYEYDMETRLITGNESELSRSFSITADKSTNVQCIEFECIDTELPGDINE